VKNFLKKSIIATMALGVISTNTLAEDRDLGQIFTECGLGGIIGSGISDRETSKVMAVITNVTWDLGTTATTSALTDACSNRKVRVANFINQSFEKLEKEIAQGEGKYLDTLANLVNEKKSSTVEYSQKLRSEFFTIVSKKGYDKLSRFEKVEKLYSIAI